MGGKRPDQYAIDPRESRASDDKFLTRDEHIKDGEKQELASNEEREERAREGREGKIPVTHENPVKAKLKAANARRKKER